MRKRHANRVLLVLMLSCMWVVAFAGHYSVTYYGGTVYMVGPMNRPWVRSYGLASDGRYGGQGQSQDEPIGGLAPMPGIGWVDCSGPVTAHFTWIADSPGEEPPTCAVLTEEGRPLGAGTRAPAPTDLAMPLSAASAKAPSTPFSATPENRSTSPTTDMRAATARTRKLGRSPLPRASDIEQPSLRSRSS